jgi:ATP-dependent Clp protease protease subunit
MRLNRLMQLLADNRRPFTPIESRIVRAEAEDEATVYLYDPIVGDRITAEWWGGVCPQDFVPAFLAIDAKTIRLRVNCPGGDVFAAEAFCQAIREHKAHVVAQVEGLAASAATVLTSNADEVLITANSKFMVHQSWTMAWGNARDLREVIDLLEMCDETMYAEYERKTGADRAQIREWCEAETWFTGQGAIDAGFADALTSTPKASANAQAPDWKLNAYLGSSRDRKPVQTPAQPPAPDAEHTDHRARQLQRLQLLERLQIA